MYNLTKEYMLWKQSRNGSRSDQTVIQMKMTCSPWQKPLPKPENNLQDTYTRPEYGNTLSSSLRGGVPLFESNEEALSISSHFVTVKLNIRWPPQRQAARDAEAREIIELKYIQLCRK
jgi:hypothetical protein